MLTFEIEDRKGQAAWCCISLFQSYLHCRSISPSVDASESNGIHKWVRLDFPSCAEVWHCLLYWCRDTGTVLTWWVLPESKQLVSSTAAEKGSKFYWSLEQSVPRTPSVMTGTSFLHLTAFCLSLCISLPFCLSSPVPLHFTPPPLFLLKLIPILLQITEPTCLKENVISI